MRNRHQGCSPVGPGSGPIPFDRSRNPAPVAAALLGVALVIVPAAASPQMLNDPTRPPGVEAAVEPAEGATGGGLTLQTVMISPTYKAAIINGVLVKLGEKFGDAELVGVEEDHVVLKSGTAKQVVKFSTTVVKSEVKPGAEKNVAGRKDKPHADGPAAPGGR
jgi:hypothetical protein